MQSDLLVQTKVVSYRDGTSKIINPNPFFNLIVSFRKFEFFVYEEELQPGKIKAMVNIMKIARIGTSNGH